MTVTRHDNVALLRKYCRLSNQLTRNLLCEFFGTSFLMYTGFNVNAQTVLSCFQMNTSLGIALGWGLCLTFAVQMGYRITGAHYNPAVTLFCWSFGNISFINGLLYMTAQCMGAFFGALLTFILYYDKINEFDGGKRAIVGANATAGIFATYPGEHLSMFGAIYDQIACTMVMCIVIGIITDERNRIPKWAHPLLFGLMLITISLGFGLNAGNAMNPARDFAPRLFTLLAGYGWGVFSYRNYSWFWVPVVCPMIGALLGAWLYKLLIGIQMDDDDDCDARKGEQILVLVDRGCYPSSDAGGQIALSSRGSSTANLIGIDNGGVGDTLKIIGVLPPPIGVVSVNSTR